MKKRIQFALAMLLLLLSMACKREPDISCNCPTNDLSLSRKLIIGTWRLHRVRYFINTDFTWYALDTIHADYEFRKDGTLWYYKNSQFIDSCKYEIDVMKKYTLYQGDTTRNTLWVAYFRHTMGLERLVPISVCNDSLYLKYQSFAYDTTGDEYFYRVK